MKSLSTIACAASIAASAQAITILNSTTFEGTEPTSDGNATGFRDPSGGAGFDTVNGWTWGSNFGGLTGGPFTDPLFTGLDFVGADPSGAIQDQEIRTTAGAELDTSAGTFQLGYGNETNAHIALAQAFTLTNLDDITVDLVASLALDTDGAYLYVDNGSGSWQTRAHTITGSGSEPYSFTPTGTNIRIAFVANDGASANLFLSSIEVSQDTVDTTAPLLSSTDPVDGATDVVPYANLVATFHESIALTGSGSIIIKNLKLHH